MTITANESSPTVRFNLYVSVGSVSSSGHYINIDLEAINTGNSTSHFNNSGSQTGLVDGGTGSNVYSATPFLPNVAAGARRWYKAGPNAVHYVHTGAVTVTVRMQLRYGTINKDYTQTLSLPARVTAPAAPSVAIDQITASSMRYTITDGSNGGSAVTEREMFAADDVNFSLNVVKYTGSTTESNLPEKKRRYVGARTRNSVGWGPFSPTVNAITLGKPDKPTLILNQANQYSLGLKLTRGADNGSAINLEQIEWATNPSFTGSTTHTVVPENFSNSGNNYDLPLPNRGTDYWLRYRTRNAIGYSEYSAVLAASTIGTPPSAPTGYAAYRVASTSEWISLGSLADNGGRLPSKVRVQVASAPNDSSIVETIEQAWAPVLVYGRNFGSTHYIRQAAYNNAPGGGWGPYGAWITVPLKNNVPNGPVLSANDVSGDNATLQWTAPTNLGGSTINRYDVLVSRDREFTQDVQTFQTTSLTQVVTGLQQGTSYWAIVWSQSSNGEGSVGTPFQFTTTGEVSTEKFWFNDDAGVPRSSVAWYNLDGVWTQDVPWMNILGIWK